MVTAADFRGGDRNVRKGVCEGLSLCCTLHGLGKVQGELEGPLETLDPENIYFFINLFYKECFSEAFIVLL